MAEAQLPHSGHRDRLRERFLKAPESLPDYELLEMFLFMAIPRRDVKPLAKTLLSQFGDLHTIMAASLTDLQGVDGVSDNTAIALKGMNELTLRLKRQEVMHKPLLNNWDRLMDYLHLAMAKEKREQIRILFMDKRNHLIADEVQQIGTVDQSSLYPREVVKRALELSATALVLVHNHPSGDTDPSQDDIVMTQGVVDALRPIGIILHDHLIVGAKGYYSFKSNGLID